MTNLNKKIIWSILLGVAVLAAVTFLADFASTVEAIRKFDLVYLPLILGLTFLNYLLRFVKWQFFLRQIDLEVPLGESFRIFLSGLAMTVTPGKAGELLKSLLLKELKGAAVSRTAPVVFAERLSDGLGLVILAVLGAASFRHGKEMLIALTVVMVMIVVVIKSAHFRDFVTRIWSRIPFLKKFTTVVETLINSADRLLSLKALLFTITLSVVSWFFESIAFYYVFVGLGYKVSILVATFTLAFSSIVGSVSMLPGGLLAAEGSIMGLLVKVAGVPTGIAAVATIIIRFCTLWFGVLVGLLAIVSNRRLLGFVNRIGSEKGAQTDEG